MIWVAKQWQKLPLWAVKGDQKRSVSAGIATALRRLKLMNQVRRERKELMFLTDDQLRDIGLHRADADSESERGYLDVPEHRF